MKGAIAPAGEAAFLEQQLAEQPFEIDAAGREDAEVAVQRQDPVVVLQRGGDADADRFLADAGEPFRQLPLPQQAEHFFFDEARQQQRAVERWAVGCGNHRTAPIVLYSRREIDADACR